MPCAFRNGGSLDTETSELASSSSVSLYVHRDIKDYWGLGDEDGHLQFLPLLSLGAGHS